MWSHVRESKTFKSGLLGGFWLIQLKKKATLRHNRPDSIENVFTKKAVLRNNRPDSTQNVLNKNEFLQNLS